MNTPPRYRFVIRAIIVATIIMCLQAAGFVPAFPWQLTILICLVFGLFHETYLAKDRRK